MLKPESYRLPALLSLNLKHQFRLHFFLICQNGKMKVFVKNTELDMETKIQQLPILMIVKVFKTILSQVKSTFFQLKRFGAFYTLNPVHYTKNAKHQIIEKLFISRKEFFS